MEKTGGGRKGSEWEILIEQIGSAGTCGCSYPGCKVVAGNNEDKELDDAGFILLVVFSCSL